MTQLGIKISFFLHIFFIILSFQTSYAFEKKQTANLQIEKFFKNLTTLEANFIQVSPSGNVSNGKIYLDLPGKLRLDYEDPNSLLITCKGFWIVIQDRSTKTTNNIPGVIRTKLNHPYMPRSSPSISNPKTEPIGGTEDNMADIDADPIFCEA